MRHAFITGANRGLGLEFCRQLLAEGWGVHACCRAPESADALAKLAIESRGGLRVMGLDVADGLQISELPGRLEGVGHLDLLVNNAGVLVSGERFGNVRAEDLVRSFAVNACAPLLITQSLAPLLGRGHHARVLCVSSQLGSIAQAHEFRTVSYAVSKAALNMGVRRLAAELGRHGVTVVAMHPGWVRTDMGGTTAPLTPEVSVRGMLRIAQQLTPEDGGRFYAHDGSELPW